MNSKLIKISLISLSILVANAAMSAQNMPPAKGGCPAGGCPAGGGGGGGGCPTGDCEIPPDASTHQNVQMPDLSQTEPTQITPTKEDQMATDMVDYHQTEHIYQPAERHHTVNKHRHKIERYFKRVVKHPTFRRINRVTRSASSERQVMPVEEVMAPPVDYGCSGVQEAPPVRVVVPVAVPVRVW